MDWHGIAWKFMDWHDFDLRTLGSLRTLGFLLEGDFGAGDGGGEEEAGEGVEFGGIFGGEVLDCAASGDGGLDFGMAMEVIGQAFGY